MIDLWNRITVDMKCGLCQSHCVLCVTSTMVGSFLGQKKELGSLVGSCEEYEQN